MRNEYKIISILCVFLLFACKEDKLADDNVEELRINSVKVEGRNVSSRVVSSTVYGSEIVAGFSSADQIQASYYFEGTEYTGLTNISYTYDGTNWSTEVPIVRPYGLSDWDNLKISFYYNIDANSYHETSGYDLKYYAKQETGNGYVRYYDMLYATTETAASTGNVTITPNSAQCDVEVNFKHICALLKTGTITYNNMGGYVIDTIVAKVGCYTEKGVIDEYVYVNFALASSGDWVAVAPTKEAIGCECRLESFTFKCTNGVSPVSYEILLDNTMTLESNKCYPYNVILYRDLIEITLQETITQWPNDESLGFFLTDDGYFEIWTGEDMYCFANMVNSGAYGCKGRIMGDVIDISAYPNWIPIGSSSKPYRGILDGNGKSLCGLNISSTQGGQGLFGCIEEGTIKDLQLYDCDVSGIDTVGILVGNIEHGTISNCSIGDNVKLSGVKYVGGLVGIANTSIVQKCTSKADVISTGTDDNSIAGEVVGSAEASSVLNCTALGSVKNNGNGGKIGGILGLAVSGSTVKNCKTENGQIIGFNYVGGIAGHVSTSSILGECTVDGCAIQCNNKYAGGIAGLYTGSSNVITDCKYLNSSLSGCGYLGGIIGDIQSGAESITSCLVRNCDIQATLECVGGLVGNTLLTDVDISDCVVAQSKIVGTSNSYGGIIGHFRGGEIKNCRVDTLNIEGDENVGGIVGWAENESTVKGCGVEGILMQVTESSIKDRNLGGLIGNAETVRVEDSYCKSGKIEASTSNNVGGLIGIRGANVLSVCQCDSMSIVGNNNVGGFVGHWVAEEGNISQLTGSGLRVKGTQYVGGMVGFVEKNKDGMYDCILTCDSISATGIRIGGMVGYMKAPTIVKNCELTIQKVVEGSGSVGGIVGQMDDTKATIYNSKMSGGQVKGNGNVGAVGGAVGELTNGSLFYCSTNTNVYATGVYGGGFCGKEWTSGTFMACHSSGTITSTANFMGGFLGYGSSTINVIACGSSCNVLVNGGGTKGGFAGYVKNSVILSCYSSGTVVVSGTVGSFIGEDAGSTITNCVTTGNTGNAGNGIGKITSTNISGCMTAASNATDIANTLRTASLYGIYNSLYWYPDSFWDATNKEGIFPAYNTTFYTGDSNIR